MTPKTYLLFLSLLLGSLFSHAADRPNIILMMADDQAELATLLGVGPPVGGDVETVVGGEIDRHGGVALVVRGGDIAGDRPHHLESAAQRHSAQHLVIASAQATLLVAPASGDVRGAEKHVGVGTVRASVHGVERRVLHAAAVEVRDRADRLAGEEISDPGVRVFQWGERPADVGVAAHQLGKVQRAPVHILGRRARGQHRRERENRQRGATPPRHRECIARDDG